MVVLQFSSLFCICLVLIPCLNLGESARILGIFPMAVKSHWAVHEGLIKELLERGHELTVVTPFPEKSPPTNLKQIAIQADRSDIINKTGHTNSMSFTELNPIQMTLMIWGIGNIICDEMLQQEAIQELINSEQHFDLIILEGFFIDAFLGFVHKFKAPLIQIITFGGLHWMHDWVGNTSPYSYIPDSFLGFTDKMSFWERLQNTVLITFEKVTRRIMFLPEQQRIMEKYFGPLPSISDIHASTSLMFVNNHFSISSPRPLLPNIVEVGGMHIKPPKKLPEDLQKYLDDAPDGVIYFSLGSHFYSSDMPDWKVNAFLEVFSKLKQKVLWKWEKDSLPGQPKNVKLGKWLPQSDILAHPNVKLFITHGGLLSTQETINRGVPILGIPLTADQKLNTERNVLSGIGVKLDYNNVTTESLTWALNEVLQNPRYYENAQRTSKIYRDQPLTPLETAVFWTEYVIRHKGAPHIRSAALELTWYQYFLLDVIAVLTIGAGIVLLVSLLILRILLKKCFRSSKSKRQVSPKKKKN